MSKWNLRIDIESNDYNYCDTLISEEYLFRLLQRMKRDWLSEGRRPSGLCGAGRLMWHDCCYCWAVVLWHDGSGHHVYVACKMLFMPCTIYIHINILPIR